MNRENRPPRVWFVVAVLAYLASGTSFGFWLSQGFGSLQSYGGGYGGNVIDVLGGPDTPLWSAFGLATFFLSTLSFVAAFVLGILVFGRSADESNQATSERIG